MKVSSLDLAIESFSFLFYSLVWFIKENYKKMEVKLCQILYLYKVFLENYESDNCYEVLKEEFNKMFDVSSLNVKHDCNVASMNSLNIQ